VIAALLKVYSIAALAEAVDQACANMKVEGVLAVIAIVVSVVTALLTLMQFLITRYDLLASAKEKRLQDLELRYSKEAQPAMAQARVPDELHCDSMMLCRGSSMIAVHDAWWWCRNRLVLTFIQRI
jgi:hypothetical protein